MFGLPARKMRRWRRSFPNTHGEVLIVGPRWRIVPCPLGQLVPSKADVPIARARLATSRTDSVGRLVAGDNIGGARSIGIPDRTDLYQSLIAQADPMSGGVMPGNLLPLAHVNGLSSSLGYPDLSGRLHAMLDPSDTM